MQRTVEVANEIARVEREAAVRADERAKVVAELRDMATRFGLAGQVDASTLEWAANHIEAKFNRT